MKISLTKEEMTKVLSKWSILFEGNEVTKMVNSRTAGGSLIIFLDKKQNE